MKGKLYCEKCRQYLSRHDKWHCPVCHTKVQEIITRDPSKKVLRYLGYAGLTVLCIMGGISIVYGVYNVFIVGV